MIIKLKPGETIREVITTAKRIGASEEGKKAIRNALEESATRIRKRRAGQRPITYKDMMTEHYPL